MEEKKSNILELPLNIDTMVRQYQKIDIIKAGRFNDDIVMDFFQIDYLAMAIYLQKHQSNIGVAPTPPPADCVTRVVMNFKSFETLKDEVNKLYDKIKSDFRPKIE